MDRGKARYALISAGSNTVVKATPGSLYALTVFPANGGTVKVNDGALGATSDMNAASANSIDLLGPFTTPFAPFTVTYGPGVGFEFLSIAGSSNTRISVTYE